MIHCHCCGDVCSCCGRCRICGQWIGRWHHQYRPPLRPRPHGPWWGVGDAVATARDAMRR